jgi:hypothetical protein
VNGLSIRQQNDTQDPVLHFGNLSPTTNASIGLDGLARGLPQHTLNPLIMDQRSIRTAAGVEEVLGSFRGQLMRLSCSHLGLFYGPHTYGPHTEMASRTICHAAILIIALSPLNAEKLKS